MELKFFMLTDGAGNFWLGWHGQHVKGIVGILAADVQGHVNQGIELITIRGATGRTVFYNDFAQAGAQV